MLRSLSVLLVAAAPVQAQNGKPPKAVKTDLCKISNVFTHLQAIKTSSDCRSGCAGGKCPQDWYPSGKDQCSASCGKVFEPFWDQCGSMLVASKMGGMDQMGKFYQNCLQSLYPPGMCGVYCNDHTFDCYMKEVAAACCDEGGKNCVSGNPVPKTCPVGCAVVFPTFNENCKDHIKTKPTLKAADFQKFEDQCLKQDAVKIVEYALSMREKGCTIDLGDGGKSVVGRRRLGGSYLSEWLDSDSRQCTWDQVDDYAKEVDKICCGKKGTACLGGSRPKVCSPACTVAMHQFTSDCKDTLGVIMPPNDFRRKDIEGFEQLCFSKADPAFFLRAIMKAKCPKGFQHGTTVVG